VYLVLLLAALGGRFVEAGAQARGPWQNVQILGDASPEDLDLFMRAMNSSLGVDCDHCHDADAWNQDTRQPKLAARRMMRMLADLSENGFEALDLPSCWTCHRGQPEPAPAGAGAVSGVAAAFSPDENPFREPYTNLQILRGEPQNVAAVMGGFSRDLGQDCEYCHVPGDWANDEKVTKLLTRRMYEIQADLNVSWFEGTPEVSCWTCHRGERIPRIALPQDLLAR
jgi:Photosynthetic reaction centre cytochrome C subunit